MQAATSDHQFLSRAADIEHVLRERVALLPGVRDRENRPIIFVPARDVSTHQDHLRNLLIYLYDVTADDAKTRGFTFVFDMRRGTSWEIVKPILKFLQEYFPVHINCVYILRPEKFFEKYKISTSKYNKFGVNMISLEELPKHIDFCQIIREFGGSMRYDHDEWIEIRKDIERIVHRMSEILKNLERMAAEMGNAEMPVDVPTAKTANARHQELYPIIAAVPTDEFESEINQLKNRVLSSGNQLNGMHKGLQNGSLSISPNPDLISVFPHLSQLLHTLMKTRTDVWYKWDSRKNDLDRYAQLKLFEQDAEELSRWICSQFERLTHQFVLIGESELESNRLLKEHKDFADAVNKIEVSYKQVLTVGHRLMQQFQTHGMNRIENISQQLKSDWTQFVSRIDQRTQLLQLALNAHRKCNAFLRNAKNWLMNVGVDPSSIKSQEELPTAAKKHHDFQKLFQTAYTEAFEETNELAKALRRLYRDAVEQLPAYQLVQTQIQEITRTNREIHGIWESRNQTINIKAQSTVFISDLKSVLNWLTDHGEPFMRRKIGIGVDRHSSSVLCETHNKFRYVAINTHKNAEQIFALAGQLRDSDDSLDPNVFLLVEELRRRSDKFRKCIDQRTNLLCVAHYFFLHYEEIMAWYQKMEERMDYIRIVPETVEQGEQNKEKFHTENQCTKSAYDRVMFEAQQLLQSLAHQRELLDVDNTETTVHVQTLIRDIENQHQKEKTCWQDQRTYLNVATMICTFLRDCDELNKQLVSWRHDLLSLRNSVSTNVEVTKQFHTQNTVKVQQVVFDAMKLLSDILREIESKSLHFIYAADPNQPIKGVLTASAKQLQNLEMEVMNIAKDVSNCIELNMQLTRLRHIANEVIQSIERQQMRLMQESLYRIPGSHQELDIQTRDFQEFRVEIEATEMDVRHFYEEKDRFTNLPVTALESQAETRMRAENLCSEVRMKWQNLVGLVEGRNKLISAAGSYYKYTKLVIPTSQSIERDLLVEKESDFCQSADWGSLERCFEAINERIEKQSSHKERFMEASVYAQRTADVFIRQIRRCEAPREHIESKLCEVQEYKDVARERQTYIFRLWMECNAQLEQCRDAVKIQLMAKEIIDWADREMATCVKIIAHLDQIKKSGEVGERRAKLLEALLERCLEQSDLIKVQRYELRKMVQEGRRFLSERSGDQHAAEINRVLNAAPIRFKNIWDMLSECEQAVRAALSSGSNNDLLSRKSVEQSFSLDRYSDSTIEDKLRAEANKEQSGDGDVVNKKIMEPMRELIKSERDYIEDMRRCVDVYLYAYKTAGSMCPMELRAKERQIFGNIEELYQFHSSIFLNELMAYEQNPEDVGYCFIEWMEKLKELYADYCLNKEENSALVCHPDAIKMFNEIRVQNELDLCHDLQSLVIKPVQRITKYHILLKELLKHSKKNSKEIKNAYDIVLSIPKLANDRMHLKSFENHQEYAIGDFVMQDIFLVSEPKRYFKRERELQVFLFESNIVFAKREELSSRKINYAYKDSMLLREVHVVEHIEGDNTKFGLRKSAFPHQNDQNTTVLKANSESVRMYWVRTLRDLKLDMGRQKMSIDERPPSFVSGSSTNRASRDSQSSLIAMSVAGQSAPEDRNSVQSVESNNNNSLSTPQVVLRARESTPTAGQTLEQQQLHRDSPTIMVNGKIDSAELKANNSFSGPQLEENAHILFYSPNAVPDEIKLLDEFDSENKVEIDAARPATAKSISPLSCTSIKISTSMVDFLPSRFPTDDFYDDEEPSELMTRSTFFASSIIEGASGSSCAETSAHAETSPEERYIYYPSKMPFSRSARRFSISNKNLSKIFRTFREQLERTKLAFRNSLTDERKDRTKMTVSRSFPISSTSMSSLDSYVKSALLKDAPLQQDKFTVAEDFTANGPDQLSVRSGQQIRVLPSQPGADPPSGRGADYVKVSLAEDAERPQRSGYVPRCILVADTDSPGTSSQSQEEIQAQSLATSTGNKRTSIRRFFSSNQSAKSGSNRHSSSNANCTAADQPSCSADLSQQHSATASDLPDPSSVLSSVQPPSTTASATLAQSFGTTAARGSSDLDLPPPMSQLGSAAAVGAEHTNNVDDTSELTNEVQPNMESTTPTAAGEEPSSSSAPNAVNTPVEAMSAEDSAKLKRSYVLQELVESERTYVQDLASIVEGYIGSLREMELGDEDREKIKIIFANIEQILDFHRTFFLKEIEKSLVSHDAAGNAFIKYERRLHTFYVKYCQNKPKSDFLVGQDNFEQLLLEIKEKLGHKVALSDLLIKPVQRITKYQLMLNDILKYTHRAKDNADVLERAHDIMRVVPKACDDMMQVGRLQGFQGNLNAQGRLIFQGTLCISDGGTAQPFKGKERRVFLFEQSVIIAECIPPRKEYGNPTYNFKHQIMVNKMMLDDKLPEEPLRFVLQSNDPNQQATYVVQAASAEDKEQWLNKLSAQLDQQKTFLAALVDPKRYQNQLANSMGSLNLGGKKDSSGSLGTPTSPAPSSATSPTKPQGQKSGSKLFGFGKPK